MRMSCNGCRVLRKGCNENCSIRPCLQWIKSPESQANATVFLAKFYGRAGLMNLINAGPDHLRPAIFRSLLYESCGRMVNPIYGSVGLLWSGQWNLCQAAVEAVLKSAPITPIPTEAAANPPPVKGAYDIRHVMTKDEASNNSDSAELHQTKPVRTRFRRTGGVVKPKPTKLSSAAAAAALAMMADRGEMIGSSTSHDSSVSHPDEASADTNSNGNSCMASAETTEEDVAERGNGLELELTLGFGMGEMKSCMVRQGSSEVEDDVSCRVELGLF